MDLLSLRVANLTANLCYYNLSLQYYNYSIFRHFSFEIASFSNFAYVVLLAVNLQLTSPHSTKNIFLVNIWYILKLFNLTVRWHWSCKPQRTVSQLEIATTIHILTLDDSFCLHKPSLSDVLWSLFDTVETLWILLTLHASF